MPGMTMSAVSIHHNCSTRQISDSLKKRFKLFLTGGLQPPDPLESSASGLPDSYGICYTNQLIREAGGPADWGVWGV